MAKIVYCIYSQGNAVGGHFHSLDQVSRACGELHQVKVISIGKNPSPIISANPFFENHFFVSGIKSIPALQKSMYQLLSAFKADILHCFDTRSLNYMQVLPATGGVKLVLNKCGGSNPLVTNWQHADGLVLFSAENFEWFQKNKFYKDSLIHIISNRVQAINFIPPENRVEQKQEGSFTFLRVTRLGGAYDKTLRDTFKMIETLRQKFQVELIVIGKIQDNVIFESHKKYAHDNNLPVRFITDERAAKGSQFLYLADAVIGTGRSFMEAISLGIPSFAPAANAEWPVLVTTKNFFELFTYNFSERSKVSDESLISNRQAVEKLIINTEEQFTVKKEMERLFLDHFHTSGIVPKYTALYDAVIKTKISRFNLIRRNLKYLIKEVVLAR